MNIFCKFCILLKNANNRKLSNKPYHLFNDSRPESSVLSNKIYNMTTYIGKDSRNDQNRFYEHHTETIVKS